MTTRNGKIARLSHTLREEINLKLDSGEAGVEIAAWLNTLNEVHALLAERFDSKPISSQNVSEWRQGGFLEWQAMRDMAHGLLHAGQGERIASAQLSASSLINVFLGRCATGLSLGDDHIARLDSLFPMVKTLLAVQRGEWAAERATRARDRHEQRRVKSSGHNPAQAVTELPIPLGPAIEEQDSAAPASRPEKVSSAHPTPASPPTCPPLAVLVPDSIAPPPTFGEAPASGPIASVPFPTSANSIAANRLRRPSPLSTSIACAMPAAAGEGKRAA